MSNWTLLTSHLGRITESVSLTFPELAAIVGGLPNSASKHRAWWSGDRTHVRAWKSAGFEISDLELGSRVTFSRMSSGGSSELHFSRKSLPARHVRSRTLGGGGNKVVEDRVSQLVSEFALSLDVYDQQVPFKRTGQYLLHRATIDRLRTFLNVHDAIQDEDFLESVHKTLYAWGIGKRGSRLVPLVEFEKRLRECSDEIASFENLRLDDPELDATSVAKDLWQLIEHLRVVENKSLKVPGSKTLHYLLLDLVPPMDRAWTGAFFLWLMGSIEYEQRTFVKTYSSFAAIAQATNPSSYVGDEWRSSLTKILDNSVIGYCKLHGIEARSS